jgi:thioredoxin-related protein
MTKRFSILLVTIFFFISACDQEKKQKEEVLNELFRNEIGLSEKDRAGQIYYIINSMSCETCIEMNLDYFTKNYDTHNINLILVNKNGFSRFDNFQKVLDSNDKIHWLREEQVSLYKIRTLDPLLIIFGENGKPVISKNIEDDDVFHLNQIIDEII